MTGNMDNTDPLRLGRLCDPVVDAGIVPAPPFPGIDRMEARFFGNAFSPHRHDTYAIGVTLHGIQTFTYRGATHYSKPGDLVILHPDELHDGGAATEDGLRYRMLYLEPSLLQKGLGHGWSSLPFVGDPVVNDPALRSTLLAVLSDIDGELDDLLADQLVAEVADGLTRNARGTAPEAAKTALNTVALARDYLDTHATQTVRSSDLEAVSGMDRFSLSRQFKALLGTSPHRYLTMRRLGRARAMIETGIPLAEAAAAAGFADQSHLNRQFKKAFGMTPGRWSDLTARSRRVA
jgi:AraC-like DNA-binding protein